VKRGLFISFEGVEGSGKTTQISLLAKSLEAAGYAVEITREPGGTPLGEAVRDLLLKIRRDPPSPLTELLLLESSRSHLVAGVIEPALEAGRIVICDRYADASLAYQWGGRGLPRELVEDLNRVATQGLIPGLTVLLDVDPAEGRRRQGRAGMDIDRMESEELDFHRRVRRAYLTLAAEEPGRFLVLDAAGEPQALAGKIAGRILAACREL
jgi:dTMP kinase